MSEQSLGRKLPPLSPKSTTSENVSGDTKKKKKHRKKKTYEDDEGGTEMDETRDQNTARPKSSHHKKKKSTKSPASEDDENLDPVDRPTKPKKKKPVGTSREALVSGEEALTDRSHSTTKKKKKRKKKKPATSGVSETEEEEEVPIGLAAELGDLRDDVVEAEKAMAEEEHAKWAQPAMRSEPVSKVFIEQKSGFKAADKHKLAKKRLEEQVRYRDTPTEIPSQTTIQFALTTHRIFKTMTVFLQGLFAGIALWQIVGVYMLSNQGYDIFLQYYSEIALPVQCVFYFLFAVSTVAAFDRYDIGRPNKRFLQRAFTLQSGAISCAFYFIGLVISTSIAATDDKIGLHRKDDTLWEDAEARDSELNTWRILNLVRGLCPILGWFVVSLRPNTDRLTKNLLKADENILMEQQTYMNNIGDSSGV